MKAKIKLTSISDNELDKMYGSCPRIHIGDCVSADGHYYKQRNYDLLHVYNDIINSVHNSILDKKDFKSLSNKKFDDKLRSVIFKLEIFKYAKENDD